MNGDAFPANIPKAQARPLYAKGSGDRRMSTGSARWSDILDQTRLGEAPSSSCASCWIPTWFKNYYEDKDGIYENDVIGKIRTRRLFEPCQDFYTDCLWYRH